VGARRTCAPNGAEIRSPVAVDVEERATVRIKSLMTPRVLRAVRRLLIRTADVLSQEVRCEDSHEDQ
jgi:hypothetical protein